MTLRKRFFILPEMRNGNAPSGRILNSALMLLILINVLAVILESEDSIRAGYGIWLAYVEVGSVAVFTIEYLFRLWVSEWRHCQRESLRRDLPPSLRGGGKHM